MTADHQQPRRGQAALEEVDRRYDELYDRFAKPLENTHRGEYLAVSAEGKTLLGNKLTEVARAARAFGPGVFIFKVGDDVVGAWR